MIIRNRNKAEAFTTADGSTIRSLLDLSVAPVQNQSLAEAELEAGQSTTRHRHPRAEEFYYIVAGQGRMEMEGEWAVVGVGDAIQIPPGAAHKLLNTGEETLRLLCCCSPPYAHEDTELLE